jgi:glycosyltransferase involved in cell wall biosynthesis
MKSDRPSPPRISVLMPVLNREAFLGEAIESILGQTCADFEFLILDSSSREGVTRIIRDYAGKDGRIRPFLLGGASIPQVINFGVRQAAGKWIARMDSDDIAVPFRFQAQLEWMNATRVDVCGSCYENFWAREGEIWCPESHEAICREMLFRVTVLNSALMMRTETARNDPYREDILLDDYEWPIRMTSRARLGNVPLVLVERRCHEQQFTKKEAAHLRAEFQKLRFQYFYTRYPDTPLQDYLALARISDRQPMKNFSELRRAGQWLVDLARHPDPLLRNSMARRWQETCERSQHLGNECQAVYQEYLEQFYMDEIAAGGPRTGDSSVARNV